MSKFITPTRLAVSAVVLLQVVLLLLIPALGVFDPPEIPSDQGTTREGEIVRLVSEQIEEGPRGRQRTQVFEVVVDGQRLQIEQQTVEGDPIQRHFRAGSRVLVTETQSGSGASYFISDFARGESITAFLIAFAVLVIAIARWQGLFSLVGMGLSLLVILRFIIPGIVSGVDPVVIAVMGALAILASNLILSHGPNAKTLAAFLGTAACLALTALLAEVGIAAAHLSGLADDESATLAILTGGSINGEGLLLAGIIIGALGVLDDVAVAQASAVFNLKEANQVMSRRALYSHAMAIGRDHIASTVNTLFLAYAGASLPLLMILSLSTESAWVITNREFLATEVFRALTGSIGIVASVPLTTLAAIYLGERIAIRS